jgi:hypothetical protein
MFSSFFENVFTIGTVVLLSVDNHRQVTILSAGIGGVASKCNAEGGVQHLLPQRVKHEVVMRLLRYFGGPARGGSLCII